MNKFFERRVERVSIKSLYFFLLTFTIVSLIILFQIIFIGFLKGNHRYTWMIIPTNPSNILLWTLSGIILAIDFLSNLYIIMWLIRKIRNPFIYKSNLFVLIWMFSIFIINILVPNLIPLNYIFPIISIILGSVSTVII